MALIKEVRGFYPKWGEDCWFADNATMVGDVIMGDQCSVWFQAVIRGDVNAIRIGNRVNIQDGAVLHCTYEKTQTIVGDDVTIGHNAIVHGCKIEDKVLIGMGAIVMDDAIIATQCLIAAGAVVLEGTICEAGFLYAGVPARKIKPVSDKVRQGTMERIAQAYINYAAWFKGGKDVR